MPISGVNTDHYSDYDFADHAWAREHTARPHLLKLTRRCVKIGSRYFYKIPNCQSWGVAETAADATKYAYNTWLHTELDDGTQVTVDLIKTFFTGIEEVDTGEDTIKMQVGSCPVVQGRMFIPYGPRFIKYGGKPYLNVSDADVITGSDADLTAAKNLLLLIYRSLCSGPELSAERVVEADMVLKQVLENRIEQLEFRFVMHWLAAIVQRPGINLQTNLWFCGQRQGVGKGTLMRVMRTILGESIVGKLNQSEIEGGWTDNLFGKVLIEADEFDTSGKMSGTQWNKWVKAYTCETLMDLRTRNLGTTQVLAIGNFVFTTNDETPMYMDTTDRRNMMVKTLDSTYWPDFASKLNVRMNATGVREFAVGLAWIFQQIKIDMPLIMTAPLTQIKSDNQAAHKPVIEEWLSNDPNVDRNTSLRAHDLYVAYTNWHATFRKGVAMTETKWGSTMTGLVQRGMVTKMRADKGVYYSIPEEIVEAASDVKTGGARNDIAALFGEPVDDTDNDAPVVIAPSPVAGMSKMDRFRARLAAQDNVIDFRSGDFM